MKCERAIEVLTQSPNQVDAVEQRFAAEHLGGCEDCQDAIDAIRALQAERTVRVPDPPPQAFERAVRAATSRGLSYARSRRTFWIGMSVGAALAAGLAVAIVSTLGLLGPAASNGVPRVDVAVNEPRDVSIALASEQALEDAEIRIVLTGAIALDGFQGRKELSWRTNLDAGANQLTLPIIALGAQGGQVLVEVTHARKHRTFVVDVKTNQEPRTRS